MQHEAAAAAVLKRGKPGEASVYIFLTHRAEVICNVQIGASNLFLLFTWEAANIEFKAQTMLRQWA